HLVSLGNVSEQADKVYEDLTTAGVEVLYDDREASAGVKLADAELLGMPTRVVISPKTLEKESVEVTDRASGKTELVPLNTFVKHLTV
ncbi:MAG: His/Gly/Thr/Pro-type tRNA ligase C-terminal domain-containing protein, partial [bacterium]|nr:His/Gly/Thr/Pro-type tRNA ligase C-terminal domain-containing protein [bacterium]